MSSYRNEVPQDNLFLRWIFYLIFKDIGKSKGEAQASAVKEFIENLKILEGALGDKPLFGGEKLRFVDIAVVPFVCCVAWRRRTFQSLQDPEKVFESVEVLKKKYGVE
ncbi:hypothetical protein AMTRI_Chr10g225030 [Amborella trichopoda]